MADQEAVLEYVKNLLMDDNSEDDYDYGEDDERESETCNTADDDVGQADDQENEVDDGKHPIGKNSSQWKRIKKAMYAAIVPKCFWKAHVNVDVEASNNTDQQQGETGTSGTTSRKTVAKQGDDKSSARDAKKIKRLEKDKRELKTFARKLSDELKEKNADISKMKEELANKQEDIDRMKRELENTQKLQQSLTSGWETQKEQHQNEVKQLDSELTTTTIQLEQMKLTNHNIVEESSQLRGELKAMTKAKEELTKRFEQKETSYRMDIDKHKDSLKQTQSELTALIDEMKLTNQRHVEEASRLGKELESISKEKDDLTKKFNMREFKYISDLSELREELLHERYKNCKDGDRLAQMRYVNPLRHYQPLWQQDNSK